MLEIIIAGRFSIWLLFVVLEKIANLRRVHFYEVNTLKISNFHIRYWGCKGFKFWLARNQSE